MKLSGTVDTAKLNALIEINTLINSNYSDINALLAHILQSAMHLVEGEASSLLLVDSGKKNTQIRSCSRPKRHRSKKIRRKNG